MSSDDDATTIVPGVAAPTSEQDASTMLPTSLPTNVTSDVTVGAVDAPPRLVGAAMDATVAGPLSPPAGPTVGGDTRPLEQGQDFGARYHIIRLLGIGGMGAVYQAWDKELGVSVAIKIIRPEIVADPATGREVERRFKRELVLARQVTHKNVVRIHDLGEIDGIKYITMSYVDGLDLGTVLKRDGKLPLAKVLGIARSVASGLVAAHTAGVVHRDLKPANIMIEADGEALIMDFGIARSSGAPATGSMPGALPEHLRRAAARAAAGATAVGGVVGTVEYMAPEQAKGQAVDQRADVYAFGLILYDLLLGRRRSERAESALAELSGRMEQAPPPARSIVAEIPEAFDYLISRCLDPDPAKRYQTTGELAADLDRLDENGEPIPIRRVIGMKAIIALVTLAVGASVGTWWYGRQSLPPEPHDPVAVVIADLQNLTSDPAFDRALEPMLRRALEGASFISAYDRTQISARLGVEPPERLDEAAARELAVKHGLGVVLSGSIDRRGNGYGVSVKAIETVTGKVIASTRGRASAKDQVLGAATRLVTAVRTALGDDTSESAQQFAMASLSAASLDVVRLYAAAMEAQSRNRFDEARQNASKAVELDPNFGVGYLVLAVASRNLGRLEENQKYLNEALRHLDGMTERERYMTRGYSYFVSGDYQQCVKEYSDLIARYPADVAGHNQLALCLSNLRQMGRAMQEMEAVVRILPNHPLFRDNLALYANYASDFRTAEQEARKIEGPDAYATLALALAQLGQGQLIQARETYERLGQIGALGASFAASGLGDLAALEGRFSDAVRVLTGGAADDLAAKNSDSAAAKLAAVAYAELSRGRSRAAIEAAEEAVRHSTAVKIRFLAARTFVEAGDVARARPLVDGLAKELYAEPQAYARIVEAGIVLKEGDARQAMSMLREANTLFDTWIGLFDLGRASLAAGAFAQADSAFDVCLNARRGEALSLFVDEEPTYAYLPPVYYYIGRVREELKSARYSESYREYVNLRGSSTEDPLLLEVRKRAER